MIPQQLGQQPQQASTPSPSKLQTLQPTSIALPACTPSDKQKQKLAGEFIKRVRRQQRSFKGKMFLLRQQEAMSKRRKQNQLRIQSTERTMEDRQKKLSQIFEHLDEYEQRKKKRKQEIEDFKKELERLQNDKPLYMIRQEEYIQKHELPIILERQQKLQQVKQARKPIDWQREMAEFQNRIFELKQQKSNRMSPSESKRSHPRKSPFPFKISQSQQKRQQQEHLKTEIQSRRKRYSQQVKYHIEPFLQCRPKINSTTPKRLKQTRQVQQQLGNQYLKYCKGFSNGRRHKTEKSMIAKQAIAGTEYSLSSQNLTSQTYSDAYGSIQTVQDQQKYLSDIRLKLDMLRCMVQ